MRHEYPIKLLCEVLNISRATFYKYRNSKTQDFEEYLTIKEKMAVCMDIVGLRKLFYNELDGLLIIKNS